MRAISASIIVLSSIILGSTAIAYGSNLDNRSGPIVGCIILALLVIGMVAWFVAFLIDKPPA